MSQKKFSNGDFVAIQYDEKTFVYIYRSVFRKDSLLWGQLQKRGTKGPVLTDWHGNVKRWKFKKENLRLATDFIADLKAEVRLFRNRQ